MFRRRPNSTKKRENITRKIEYCGKTLPEYKRKPKGLFFTYKCGFENKYKKFLNEEDTRKILGEEPPKTTPKALTQALTTPKISPKTSPKNVDKDDEEYQSVESNEDETDDFKLKLHGAPTTFYYAGGSSWKKMSDKDAKEFEKALKGENSNVFIKRTDSKIYFRPQLQHDQWFRVVKLPDSVFEENILGTDP